VAAGLKYKNKTRTIQAFVDSSDMTVSASRWASHSQAHVKGVINLRGKVIPVVDLTSSSVCPRKSTRRAPASS
jgi:hypothetical protein